MKYLSVCSGIEAATTAWHPMGWKPIAFSEIEKFPSAVLAHHYPDVPNFGDMTKYQEWPNESIDLLVGGTPCQSFSVAGLRKGLDDPRGNLMLTYGAIAGKYRPRWLVWENVPGVLSSNGGRDFGAFLGMLAQLGYGFAYRVLDAQYVRTQCFPRAVPQRRRRVFVVGYFGDWRRAAAVLFERESLSRHPAPRRKTGEVTVGNLAASTGGSDENDAQAGRLIPDVSLCLNAGAMGRIDAESETMIPVAHCAVMPTMMNGANTPAGHSARSGHSKDSYVVPVTTLAIRGRNGAPSLETRTDGTANAVLTPNGGRAGIGVGAIQYGMAVRRLTPVECERLQGFPDGYTRIPWRTWQEASRKGASYEGLLHERGMTLRGPSIEECPDGPRYKAIGNSMAVNVMAFIGQRIDQVDKL